MTGPASDVVVLETEELSEEQRTALIDVCVAAHQDEEFKNLFSYIPAGARHFLGFRGSELVSHAMVTTRWLGTAGGGVLTTAFVDAVSTRPDVQGLGQASAVMRRLAEGIAEYDIGCLQTDLPDFYARLGWELWRGALAGRDADGLIPTPGQRGVMVLRLARTPPLDLDGPLNIEVQPNRIWG